MSEIKCPFCKKKQGKSIKNWKYGSIDVNRFQCKCGKFFNFYKGTKSTWTIPKTKK
jgi:hypothetical protein